MKTLYSEFYPNENSPGVVGTTVPALSEQRVQDIIDDLDIVLGDDILSRDEKLRIIIPLNNELETTFSSVLARMVSFGLNTNPLNGARNAWLSVRNGLAPAWNNTEENTTINRTAFRSAIDGYIQALVAAEDAIALRASQTANIDGGLNDNGAPITREDVLTSEGISWGTEHLNDSGVLVPSTQVISDLNTTINDLSILDGRTEVIEDEVTEAREGFASVGARLTEINQLRADGDEAEATQREILSARINVQPNLLDNTSGRTGPLQGWNSDFVPPATPAWGYYSGPYQAGGAELGDALGYMYNSPGPVAVNVNLYKSIIHPKLGTGVTVSMDAFYDGIGTVQVGMFAYGPNGFVTSAYTSVEPGEMKRYSVSLTEAELADASVIYAALVGYGITGGEVRLRRVKMEAGQVATPFTEERRTSIIEASVTEEKNARIAGDVAEASARTTLGSKLRLATATLLPSDFQSGMEHFVQGYGGYPQNRVPLSESHSYSHSNPDVAGVGRVYQFDMTGPEGIDIDIMQLADIMLRPGRKIRLTVRARLITAPTSSSSHTFTALQIVYNGAGGAMNGFTPPAPAYAAMNEWKESQLVLDTDGGVMTYASTVQNGVRIIGPGTWQIALIEAQDITDTKTNEARIILEEQTRASEDVILAQRSSIIEANSSLKGGWLNTNAEFSVYPRTDYPSPWSNYDFAAIDTMQRVSGRNGGYAVRMVSPVSAASYLGNLTEPGTLKAGEWIVIEADIKLNSGNLNAAGIYFTTRAENIDGITTTYVQFSATPDATGVAPGAGVAGKSYRFAKLFQIPEAHVATNRASIYAMTQWSGFADIAGLTNDITWYLAGVRRATAAEIQVGQATPGGTNLHARLTSIDQARIDGDTAEALARTTLEARSVGNGQGYMNLNPKFEAWPGAANSAPYSWNWWSIDGTRVQINASSNHVRFDTTGNITPQTSGLHSVVYNGVYRGWYVVSIEATLEAGTLEGAGFLFRPMTDTQAIIAYHEMMLSGIIPNGYTAPTLGVVGQTYRFDVLIDCSGGEYYNMQGMSFYVMNDGYWGGNRKAVRYSLAGYRKATADEIELRKARGSATDLSAKITSVDQARVDGDTALSLRTSVVEARSNSANLLTKSQWFTPHTTLNPWGSGNAGLAGLSAYVHPNPVTGPGAGELPLVMVEPVAGGANYAEFGSNPVPVKVGDRICFSAYAVAAACTVAIFVYYRDANNNIIDHGSGDTGTANLANTGNVGTLQNWVRIYGFHTVPAGAATAEVMLRKFTHTAGYSYSEGWFLRPMLSVATATQNQPPNWVPSANEARVSNIEKAGVDLKGRIEATAGLTVQAGNRVAGMRLHATDGTDASYSSIDFLADVFRVWDTVTSTGKAPFEVRNGGVRANAAFIDRLSVGTSLTVGTANLRVAVQPFTLAATDGVPKSYGYDLGLNPTLIFGPCPVALNTGEVYQPSAIDPTPTGFTPSFKILSPGAPTNQTQGPGGYSGSPVLDTAYMQYWQLAGAVASPGTVNITATGTFYYQFVNDGYGGQGGGMDEVRDGEWYVDGYLSLGIYTYSPAGWQKIDSIWVSPGFHGFNTPSGYYSRSYSEAHTITVGANVTHIGVGIDASGDPASTHVTTVLAYQTASSSGVRSATPNGEMITVTVNPKNGG